jgi:membrane fusion protein, multidrug efflux system
LISRLVRSASRGAGLALAGAALILAACHGRDSGAPRPAVVVALPVHALDGGDGMSVRYPVEVAARYANAMSFRVAGKLIERTVRLGDRVHKGQVVARLDATDADRQAASAKAALDAAEHRLVFAKQQLERDTAQSAQNLIAANQLEQTQDAYSASLAARDQAADQLVLARNTLAYNTLAADHDGVITSENADTGQVLAAGQAVFGLAWSGDTDVILDAAANDIGRIAVGEGASVTFSAFPGRRYDASVREVAPSADPQSRTYRVKLTLHDSSAQVRIGMTGDVTLLPVSQDPDGAKPFRVPATALFHRGNQPAVWVIRASDSTLELRPVEVAEYGARSVLLTRGLNDGDTVLLAGVHTVYAGEHVRPVKPLFAAEDEPPPNTGNAP